MSSRNNIVLSFTPDLFDFVKIVHDDLKGRGFPVWMDFLVFAKTLILFVPVQSFWHDLCMDLGALWTHDSLSYLVV